MVKLYDVVKYALLHEPPEAGPETELLFIPGMGRCQQPNPCPGDFPYGFQLRCAPQLVHRHDLGIHHPKQQRHALILGAAGEHIGTGAKIQGVFPLLLGCQLPPLIHHADSDALSAQLADQIPEKCGLSAPRRREDQGGI